MTYVGRVDIEVLGLGMAGRCAFGRTSDLG